MRGRGNKFAVLALVGVLLSGCVTNYVNAPAEKVANAVVVSDSEFDSSVAYTGPDIQSVTRRGLFVDNESLRLVALRDKKSNALTYVVQLRILYSFDWRFYSSASFTDGSSVEVKEIDRRTNDCVALGCIHTERVFFLVDFKRLKDSQDGLRFRLNGKNTTNVITIPRNYINGFMAGLGKQIAAGR